MGNRRARREAPMIPKHDRDPRTFPCVKRNKRAYYDRNESRKHLAFLKGILIREGRREASRLIHIYRCPDCGLFHLGKRQPVGEKEGENDGHADPDPA